MPHYQWKPIEPLSNKERAIDLAAMKPLYESWHDSNERLQASSPSRLREFNERLVRRLSVETGILERLYDLDRGTTEALVTHGFIEDLVSRSNTDVEPSRLIDILRDQQAAVHLMVDCVAQSRPLTKRLIHELHATLTQHQESTTAIDQFGTRREIPLLKGKYKEQPNNPRRPDGSTHEYCPPLQVDSEMDNLLAWLSNYGSEDPVIVAAWLHHRFTQIHPYQDGNGRVARALTTLILVRENLLPIIVDRDLRVKYIDALEAADGGDLSALAQLFAGLERAAILQALSVDADSAVSEEKALSVEVIDALAEKLKRRTEAKVAEFRKVNSVALALRSRAHDAIQRVLSELRAKLPHATEPKMTDGGPEAENAHWYKFEVVTSARDAGKYANFSENHYFVRGSIHVERERLVFVVSFHHVGHDLSGVMEATAFAKLVSYEGSEDRVSAPEAFILCSAEPFVLTYKTNPSEIFASFDRWMDAALAVALKGYGERL